MIGFLRDIFLQHKTDQAIVWDDTVFSYEALLRALETASSFLEQNSISAGTGVALEGDYSIHSVAMLLALIDRQCIVTPIAPAAQAHKDEFTEIAEVEMILTLDEGGACRLEKRTIQGHHPLLQRLRDLSHPGLILFSSGSTGKNKAVVHDASSILEKYRVPRKTLRTITFMLFDHIGGLNTLFYTLSNAGCLIFLRDRSPDAVCAAIARHRAQLLPVTPTFINLLLLSEAYQRYDLSSLQTVTYGTEVMPEATLHHFHKLFPSVALVQTYGLSELGILRAKSKSSDSLWVKVGGEGFETRVADGMLEIKARSAMLGYLNAPSPFTEDGWLKTYDVVEQDGDYIRILGRRSDIINVGGQKVFPAEVESVLQQMDGVQDVVVSGETHALLGHIVKARVTLKTDEPIEAFRSRMRLFCKDKLAPFKIPQKVLAAEAPLISERFKKVRKE